MKEKIIEYLKKELNHIYCGNCNHAFNDNKTTYCPNPYAVKQCFSISDAYTDKIADDIIKIVIDHEISCCFKAFENFLNIRK